MRSPLLARPRTAIATASAPHVRARGDLGSITGALLVALVPCLAFGLYNTGFHANVALLDLGRAPSGWRGAALGALGVGQAPGDVPACVLHGALLLLPLLAVALVVGEFWERLFARARDRDRQPGLVPFALLFTLALPPTLAPWQAALGMSFGIVVGKEIFGGMGRYVVHPVLVGLAFLLLTYPDRMRGDSVWVAVEGSTHARDLTLGVAGGREALAEQGITWMQSFVGRRPGALGTTSALACLIGAAFLVARRVASWRILVGVLAGAAAASSLAAWSYGPALAAATLPWHWHLTLGSFAFAGAFVATDPVTAPTTQTGRWIHGLLIGLLVVLIRVANPTRDDGTVLAILLASVFAPLVDHGVIRAHVRRRRGRPAAGEEAG